MRNEEIAELMRSMEASFKQHSDDQLAKFSTLLEQHMVTAEQRFAQISQADGAAEASADLATE